MVGDQSADCRIDDGIEGSGQLKEHGADEIDDAVDDEGHASHTERLIFFRHIEADDVIAAAAAACPQGQSHSGASQQAADDAGSEPVREDGRRGDRNEREEGGLGEDAVHRLEEERASELEKSQSQQRDIEDQVEDTGDVKAGGQCQPGLEQSADDLGDAHCTAVVEPHRDNEQIEPGTEQQGTNGDPEVVDAFPMKILLHGRALLVPDLRREIQL